MPVVIGGLILSFLIMLLFGGTELDRSLLVLFTGEAPRLRQAAAALSWLAQPISLLAATVAGAAFLFLRERRRDAVVLLALVALGMVLLEGLQLLTVSLRPERLLATQTGDYPDPHASLATLVAFALAFLATRHSPARALALAAASSFALVVGGGRLILGAAWPSDVIGGWAFGLAVLLLPLQLLRADLSDGTARPLRHSLPKGEHHEREPQDRDRPPDR